MPKSFRVSDYVQAAQFLRLGFKVGVSSLDTYVGPVYDVLPPDGWEFRENDPAVVLDPQQRVRAVCHPDLWRVHGAAPPGQVTVYHCELVCRYAVQFVVLDGGLTWLRRVADAVTGQAVFSTPVFPAKHPLDLVHAEACRQYLACKFPRHADPVAYWND